MPSLHTARRYPPNGKKPRGSRRGFSLIELLVVLAIIAGLAALLLPAVRSARPAARRTQCKNNLKNIALALHNYASDYGAFPPASTCDRYGHRLHSWRTLILPYLDLKSLYDTIDLTKPWDDPVNATACNMPVSVYGCPSVDHPQNHTTYLACVGDNACLLAREPRRLSQITDGISETLMVIEAPPEHSLPWMSPDDADEKLLLEIASHLKLAHEGGTHAALADGRVRFVPSTTPASALRALFSIAGGDQVEDF